MAWTVSDIPDLSGRVAVVTGANSGVGLESARALAGAGAHVVMAVRDPQKGRDARDDILAGHPDASLEIADLDLASLDSVRQAAAAIARRHPAVDILMNNAGVMATPERRTADGFEWQFGVNHLGHWVLTARLLPALLAAGDARVVSVTSTARHFGRRVDAENPTMEGDYNPWAAYGRSKRAIYHFALGLQCEFAARRLAARSLAAHPGLTYTNLQVRTAEEGGAGRSGDAAVWVAARTGMRPARGALPQLRAATDPEAAGGRLYTPRFANFGAPVRRPILSRLGLERSITTLWEVSERLTGECLDFGGTDA